MPKRWVVPTTTSTPNWPGAFKSTRLKNIGGNGNLDFTSPWPSIQNRYNQTPVHICRDTAKVPQKNSGNDQNSHGFQRPIQWPKALIESQEVTMSVARTSSETKNLTTLFFFWSRVRTSNNNVMASAAAVLSSNREAFANSIPVRSQIMV